jgi:hypothetical protein
MKAPDIAALDCALKVKQCINATKSKNRIKAIQGVNDTKGLWPQKMQQKSIWNNKQNEPHCKQ